MKKGKRAALPLILYVSTEALLCYSPSDQRGYRIDCEVGPGKLSDEERAANDHPQTNAWPTKAGVLFVGDLGFSAYATERGGAFGSGDVYGHDVEYRKVYSLNAYDCKRRLATLQTIERKLVALRERFGSCGFLAWVRRFCDVLGVTKIRIHTKALDRHGCHRRAAIEHGAYTAFDVEVGCGVIQRMIDTIRGDAPREDRVASQA